MSPLYIPASYTIVEDVYMFLAWLEAYVSYASIILFLFDLYYFDVEIDNLDYESGFIILI